MNEEINDLANIRKVTEELKDLTKQLDAVQRQEIAELQAENKRLRDVLRYCSGRRLVPSCPTCADTQQAAKAALESVVEKTND